jgi:hypothetical protein
MRCPSRLCHSMVRSPRTRLTPMHWRLRRWEWRLTCLSMLRPDLVRVNRKHHHMVERFAASCLLFVRERSLLEFSMCSNPSWCCYTKSSFHVHVKMSSRFLCSIFSLTVRLQYLHGRHSTTTSCANHHLSSLL